MTSFPPAQPDASAAPPGEGSLPAPGEIFDGRYRIERTLGRGAMAVVLEATHLQLDDRVAIKLLLPQWASRPELVERFMREGRAATRIRSEHVVRVFDVGVVDAHPYLVMEYLDGKDLDQILEADGPLPLATAVDYLLQACEAIAEAHAGGIVHRDLKPANLFLTRRADGSPCVKVLDFGISKAAPRAVPDTRTTEPAAIMGSPHYMSPEQMLSSTQVDARSDIWAMGAILHELLVGAPAFNAETMAALSASVLRDPPPPLGALRADVPPAVEAIVLRCLEKEPARRYSNVADLAAALAPFGTDAARASAERIARVLEGGTAKTSFASLRPPDVVPEVRVERAASLVAPVVAPPQPRGRIFGYVVAAVAVLGIGGWIAAQVVHDERAVEDGPVDAAAASVASASPAASGVGSGGRDGSALSTAEERGDRSIPPAATAGHPAEPPARPSPHARWPRRGPKNPSRTTSPRVPPLPDFPVPSADPEGEPSSRPILGGSASAPAVAEPAAVAPAAPAAPAAVAPAAPAAPATSAPPLPTTARPASGESNP